MPKWLDYDYDGDDIESEYSKRPHNQRVRKQSRITEEEPPRRNIRKRRITHTADSEQKWISAGQSNNRRTVPAR
ncbi:MAG: hypothetical protein H6967_01490 [Chromatiaceae bacterium]|nr:hypothetical protein [Chromatiaceae bacterium]